MTLEANKQAYRNYLSRKGRTENTINAYVSGVNTISRHVGQEVFLITDIEVLERLWQDYGTTGQYRDVGDQNNGSARSGLREWVELQRSLQLDNTEQWLEVELKEGAIRNGYIAIKREQMAFFSPEFIADNTGVSSKKFKLRWPDGEQVETCVLSQYHRIQARFNSRFSQYQAPKTIYISKDASDEALYFISEIKPNSVTSSPVDILQRSAEEPMPDIKVPLNQILFGPPGTGKTHETVRAALEILDPAAVEQFDTAYLTSSNWTDKCKAREALKARFDELKQQERIRFVTFHQSFSYEDFVEGLRAETVDTDEQKGQLRYQVVDGVFKNMCLTADVKVTRSIEGSISLEGRRIWKMSLGNTLGSDASVYDDCINGNFVLLGYGDEIDFSGCQNRQEVERKFVNAGVTLKGPNDYQVTSVNAFVTQMNKGDLVIVSDGNFKFRAIGEITGDYAYLPNPEYDGSYAQMRPVKWLRQYSPSLPHSELLGGQFSQMTLYKLQAPTLEIAKLERLLAPATTEHQTPEHNKRVLIIDEINRGNISRIFGELITLIEPSKRAGAQEALEVTLPYSKKPFKVPSNVYLIGTMNTADRSLAGLDIALRRRFTFKEMPPKPELFTNLNIEGVNIKELLKMMNERITVLLDRDHCLGHAYFMPLFDTPTLAKLGDIFKQNIIPLLQEYFFEDWERIRWILNDQSKASSDAFIVEDKTNLSTLFPKVSDKLRQTPQWRLNHNAFERITAYRGIVSVATSSAIEAADDPVYDVDHEEVVG